MMIYFLIATDTIIQTSASFTMKKDSYHSILFDRIRTL